MNSRWATARWPGAAAASKLLVRVGTGSLFLYAGIIKALNVSAMRLAIHGYRLAPAFLERPIAYGLPWLEIALGLFLLLGVAVRVGAVGVAVLSLVFIAVVAQALVRDLHIGCGCFGGGGGLSRWDVVRDLPLLAAGLYMAWRPGGSWRLDRSRGSHDQRMLKGTEGGETGSPGERSPRSGGWLRLGLPVAILSVAVAAAVAAAALTESDTAAPNGVGISGPARSSPIPGGNKLPQFFAPALGGGTISWASYRGGPTVLIIWAPWCTDCERELPLLTAVAKHYPAVKLTSIVTGVGQQPGLAPAAYMASHHYNFPVALDSADERLADVLGVSGFPTIYYVYPDGTIYQVTIGAAPKGVISSLMLAIAR